MDTITDYKIPLKDLNWKEIIKKICLVWIHIIGIGCSISCAIFMAIVTWSFLFPPQGIILYEFNIFIAIIEFVVSIIAVHYCIYLFIISFRKSGD